MSRNHWIPALALASLLALGCSSIKTSFDYDTGADFTRLSTFDWVAPKDGSAVDPLIRQRIERAVEQVLDSKGYGRAIEGPDFLVAAHTGRENRVSVTDWGYSYGPYGSWSPRRDVSVYEYEVGSLILDVVDAKSRRLIWRGTAEKTVDPQASPDKITKIINEAVEKILAKFPPPKSG